MCKVEVDSVVLVVAVEAGVLSASIVVNTADEIDTSVVVDVVVGGAVSATLETMVGKIFGAVGWSMISTDGFVEVTPMDNGMEGNMRNFET